MDYFNNENVFFFVPNIIGYARILLAVLSFYFMPSNYVAACICYLLSVGLDAFDGFAARLLNQSSRLGGMLDQLTDRCGTVGLLITLSCFYPKNTFAFQIYTVIDVSCHWIFLHSTILQNKQSHKAVDIATHPVMKIYYSSKIILGLLCGANETFFAILYLLHFTRGPTLFGCEIFNVLLYLCGPLVAIKLFVTLFHGYVACKNIVQIDMEERKAMKKL